MGWLLNESADLLIIDEALFRDVDAVEELAVILMSNLDGLIDQSAYILLL